MSLDIIKEYLVSIGFNTDTKSYNDAKAKLDRLEGLMSKFAQTTAGKMTMAGAAFTTFGVVASAAIAKFMDAMAKADMQTEKFARRMLTTERNARSLQSVMNAMGLESLEDLKDVSLNPELRKQFLELRQLAGGLEPGRDVQAGLARIRAVGYEFQKLQVIASYALMRVAGYLAKYLSGPMGSISEMMAKFNEKFAANIDKWADRVAKVLSWVVKLTGAILKLISAVTTLLAKSLAFLGVLTKLPNQLKLIASAIALIGVAIMTGPWGRFMAAIGSIGLLADDYFIYKAGGKSSMPGLWEGLDKVLGLLESMDGWLQAIAEKFGITGQKGYNAIKTGLGGMAGGAAMGAAAGSIIPGVGTAAGAGIGAGIGLGTGLVAGWNSGKYKLNPGGSKKYRAKYEAFADKMAAKYGIDPVVLKNLITQESGWNPHPANDGHHGGVRGIAQIKDSTARGLGVNNRDPYSSIEGAARMISAGVKKYGSYEYALAAYNGGPPAVPYFKNRGGVFYNPRAPRGSWAHETGHYVKTILRKAEADKKQMVQSAAQPTQVTINVNGAQSPEATAKATKREFEISMGTRNLQGAFA